jgi:UDP-3-O-[3-hydroxymyristoyl] glucosamine N-acyltransferase
MRPISRFGLLPGALENRSAGTGQALQLGWRLAEAGWRTGEMRAGGNSDRLRHGYDKGRSPAEEAAKQHGSQQEHKDKAQVWETRILAAIGSAKIQDRQRGALLARKQLGRHHVMGGRMGRLIQRELVAQTPREDAHPQQHQAKAQSAQALLPANCGACVFFCSHGKRGIQPSCSLDDAISLDGCKSTEVSTGFANNWIPAIYNLAMRSGEMARVLQAELRGDPDVEITGVAGIEDAGPAQVTFVANPKYAALAKTTQAGAVLVAPDFPEISAVTLRMKNPYLGFARAVEIFYQPPTWPEGIHATAVIHPSAKIGANARIGAFAVVGENVVVGDDAVILPHVVIYPGVRIGHRFFAHAHAVVREHCVLGDDVVLQNGAVVGSDGFGFAKDEAGRWHKIPQSGPAVLGDRVEVQTNSSIDRASVGATRIGDGVKVDNLVQVGHGSSVADNTLLCAQVGLAGSTHVGKNVILAGQVGVAGHCNIGDGVVAIAQAGLHGDIPPGSVLAGSPAFDHKQWLRATALFSRLPELLKQLQRKSKRQE